MRETSGSIIDFIEIISESSYNYAVLRVKEKKKKKTVRIVCTFDGREDEKNAELLPKISLWTLLNARDWFRS